MKLFRHLHNDIKGSALIIILVFLSSLSYFAIILQKQSRSIIATNNLYETRLRSDLLNSAAMNEMIVSYLGGNDVLRKSIPANGRKHQIMIHDENFILSSTAESGKVDLITSNKPILDTTLDLIYKGDVPQPIIDQIIQIRNTKNRYDAYVLIERMRLDGIRFGIDILKFFTIYSGQPKLDPETVHPDLKSALERRRLSAGTLWGRQRPIYTFSAAWLDQGTERPGLDIVVSFVHTNQYEIIAKRTRFWPLSEPESRF